MIESQVVLPKESCEIQEPTPVGKPSQAPHPLAVIERNFAPPCPQASRLWSETEPKRRTPRALRSLAPRPAKLHKPISPTSFVSQL